MPFARRNANSLVKEFMAFQTLWESQKNDPKSDTVESRAASTCLDLLMPCLFFRYIHA